MIKLKEKECISIKMVLRTLDNGIMINSMAMVIKNGLMELNMKVIMFKV